ncbi:MAG TPA: RodZ domain-containing protein [Bacteroidota bacterium]
MVTLESFAAELKKARTEKQISLMDISASTRINLKFLEAVEEGNFGVLPQTYVRAFIREYAEAVGLDPRQALKKYDSLHPQKQAAEPAAESPRPLKSVLPKASEVTRPALAFAKQNALFVGFVVIVAVFVIYLFRQTPDASRATSVAETPFDNVVQENAAALPKSDEGPVALPAVTQPSASDSLSLVMTTSDSVWMTITIDGGRILEYLFPPGRRGAWTAKESFTVTMGNAGGAIFSLNGKDLGPLGRPGAVVRDVRISASNLSTP